MLLYSAPKQEQNVGTEGAVSQIYYISPSFHEEQRTGAYCQDCDQDESVITYSIGLELARLEGIGVLKTPLRVEVKYGSRGYTIYCADLDISEYGADVQSALSNFESFLLEDSRNWQETPDDRLSDDAASLKKKYALYLP